MSGNLWAKQVNEPGLVPEVGRILRETGLDARCLKLELTGEGVETVEQSNRLQQLGCDRGQGYLFARPLRPDAVSEALSITISTHPEPDGLDGACSASVVVEHSPPPAPW